MCKLNGSFRGLCAWLMYLIFAVSVIFLNPRIDTAQDRPQTQTTWHREPD
jgi:hypothetical protein